MRVALILCLAALAAITGSEPALAAKKKPNLVVPKVTAKPGGLAAGDALRMSTVVRNAGARRAAASKVAFSLSRDRKAGRGDLKLGAAKVAALRPGKRAKAKRRATLPSTVGAGRWRVIACADSRKKVRERKEKDNCRATKKPVRVAGGYTTPPPGEGFLQTPNPLSVTPVPDESRAVEATMTQFGGTLDATGADGTQYTLTLPADALLGEELIRMTPIASIGGLPLSKGLMGAVELEPHGLQLSHPATLTIDPPGDDPPLGEQSAFLAHGTGEDFHLYPVGAEPTATIRLMHFSTTGVGLGTAADRSAIAERPASRASAQMEQAIAEATRAARAGEPGPGLGSLEAPMRAYYEQVVKPKLVQAETSERLAPDALRHALGWARNMALLGLGAGEDGDEMDADLRERLDRVLRNAIEETYAHCVVGHDLKAAGRLIGWARQAAILGIETDGFDKWVRCARFTVKFDSTVTTQGGFSGQQQSQSHEGQFRVVSEDMVIEFGGGVPTGTLSHQGSSYSSTITYPPSQSCQLVTTTSLSSVSNGTLAGALVFDINPFETPSPEIEPPREHYLRLHVQQQPGEEYLHQNSGCSTTSSTSTDTRWADIFAGFHDNSATLKLELDPDNQVLDLVGAFRLTGNRSEGTTQLTEDTLVELRHAPLP